MVKIDLDIVIQDSCICIPALLCSLVISTVCICFFLSVRSHITLTEPIGAKFFPVSFKTLVTFTMAGKITFEIFLAMLSSFLYKAFLSSHMAAHTLSSDVIFYKRWDAS